MVYKGNAGSMHHTHDMHGRNIGVHVPEMADILRG